MLGWIILATGLAIVPAALIFQYRRGQPSIWYRGVGITYDSDASKPWARLEAVIDAMLDVAREQYPSHDLGRFWIRVVSPAGKVEGFTVADGRRLNGTVDNFSAFLGAYHRHILVVRQLRDEAGNIQPATISALTHEYAEHLVPFLLHRNWNWTHAVEWHALAEQMDSRLGN